ncbi:hypothetical protein ACFQZC_28710 [Streptacidiphilus monticola]
MNQPAQHPDAEVRQALAGAIQAYGEAVLGNAQMLGNILTDLLPDHPRERSLLVVAAEAETAAQLREAVEGQRLDIGTAVDLTARTLAERRALDPVAARWATAAFAQALGHNPPPAPPAGLHQADTVRVPQQPVNPDAPTAVGAPPRPRPCRSPTRSSRRRSRSRGSGRRPPRPLVRPWRRRRTSRRPASGRRCRRAATAPRCRPTSLRRTAVRCPAGRPTGTRSRATATRPGTPRAHRSASVRWA